MSHMFCTLQEAAQTLNASEDQIRALLERGLLQEFREGPYRLLKEADVDALARKQAQRRAPEAPAPPRGESSSPRPQATKAGHPAPTGLPRSTRASSPPPPEPKPPDPGRRRQAHGTSSPGPRGMPYRDTREADLRQARETTPPRPDYRPSRHLSLGQWFWMSLIQDRPLALALLSGLILALLAALVAGLCFLAQAS